MRSLFFLLLCSSASLASPSTAPAHSARTARPPSRSEPVGLAPDEEALVAQAPPESMEAAGALGMMTALAASVVFARTRRTR